MDLSFYRLMRTAVTYYHIKREDKHMKLTKKVMALVLASCMTLFLAACGGNADQTSGTSTNEPETTEDTAACIEQISCKHP